MTCLFQQVPAYTQSWCVGPWAERIGYQKCLQTAFTPSGLQVSKLCVCVCVVCYKRPRQFGT
jgi:hypothetical protein